MKTIGILVLAWLFPGMGHYIFGKKCQGILIFIILFMLYYTGMTMANFQNVAGIRELHYFICQIGSGSFTIFACIYKFTHPIPMVYPYGYELGSLYTCIVGICNSILLLQIWNTCEQEIR